MAALLVALAAGARGAAPRFYPDDPIWVEPITQDVTRAARYEPDLVFQVVENLFARPGDAKLGQRARNVNTVDEVPDGPYFVNRAGRTPLTPEIVARAANRSAGPAPGAWTVVSAKSDGVTPGFTVRDRAGQLWFLKFDPPGWRGMATGSEMVAAKLFWAIGYHTTEYHLAAVAPDRLVIGDGARVTPPGQAARPMRASDIAWLLRRANRDADGSYRAIASRAVPGRPVGRIAFHGTRSDDPNDIVPHEHRRELRGYFVVSAWLNHVDAKGINSLSSLVTEGGRTFIRHYLLDFGSALGSAAVGPREYWEGSEPLVEEPRTVWPRLLTLGLKGPAWRGERFFESPAVGRLPLDHARWDPEKWQPHIPNAAFRHRRADDAFWAASKIASIGPETIEAAVAEGRFGDAASERALVKTIVDRRARILHTYLPAVNPVTWPSIDDEGRLHFGNAAVDAGVAQPPPGYRAAWSAYDNLTDTATPMATVEGAASPLPGVALPASGYVKVELAATGGPAAWQRPVEAYFRRETEGWSLVGLERVP